MKQILPDFILQEQNCTIPERTIFNNLFLIRDLIKYINEKKNKFYLLQIDKVDRPFLFQTLEKLGFSKNFVEFTGILYKDNKSIIANNAFVSETVSLFRGLRQGCPLFLPLYVVQREITTEKHK